MALTRAVNHLTRRWEELGLLERYREDYRRRAADPGAGAWASPLPVEEFADTYVGARAEDWLRGYQDPRPFLLVVGFGGPHPPFDAPEPYASRYRPEDLPAPIPAGESGDWLPEHVRRYMERLSGGDRRGESTPGAPVAGEEGVRISQQRMANYGGKIALIDDRVGRLLNVLDERGWTENTLVIFLSDHGEMGGDHGRYHKSVFFESSVRIPFAMRWPGGGLGGGAWAGGWGRGAMVGGAWMLWWSSSTSSPPWSRRGAPRPPGGPSPAPCSRWLALAPTGVWAKARGRGRRSTPS